jgi:FkbM family methyltransferase
VIDWHYGTRLALYMGNDLSRQIYIAGCIDPNEFAFLDRFLQPGMTFLDVGANEGIYSIFAAARVRTEGTVWAFEPSRRELERLQTNISLNDFGVRTFQVALGDINGRGELTIAGYGHEGQNTLGAFIYDVESSGKEDIELARLDDLVAKYPPSRIDLIKADVEGAELRLFLGSAETLRRYRPILLFEVSEGALHNQGSSREELFDFLRRQDYTFFHFDRNSGVPTAASPGAYSDNMIGTPAGTILPEAVFRHWPDNSDEGAQFRQAGSSAKIRLPRARKLNSVHTRC